MQAKLMDSIYQCEIASKNCHNVVDGFFFLFIFRFDSDWARVAPKGGIYTGERNRQNSLSIQE